MAKCVNCDAETWLHVKGVPICIACLEEADKDRKPTEDESATVHELPTQTVIDPLRFPERVRGRLNRGR